MSAFDAAITAARARLNAFNFASSCYACGSSEVSSFYRRKGDRDWGDDMNRLLDVATAVAPFSMIVRTCTRCRKQWAELPLNDVGDSTEGGSNG